MLFRLQPAEAATASTAAAARRPRPRDFSLMTRGSLREARAERPGDTSAMTPETCERPTQGDGFSAHQNDEGAEDPTIPDATRETPAIRIRWVARSPPHEHTKLPPANGASSRQGGASFPARGSERSKLPARGSSRGEAQLPPRPYQSPGLKMM